MNRTTVPDDMTVMDAGQTASRSGLLLICNRRARCINAGFYLAGLRSPSRSSQAATLQELRHAPHDW